VGAAQDRLHPLRVVVPSVWKITRTAEPELWRTGGRELPQVFSRRLELFHSSILM
jgi:hypothetical protein